MDNLSHHIIDIIVSYTDSSTYVSCSQINTRWRSYLDNESAYSDKLKQIKTYDNRYGLNKYQYEKFDKKRSLIMNDIEKGNVYKSLILAIVSNKLINKPVQYSTVLLPFSLWICFMIGRILFWLGIGIFRIGIWKSMMISIFFIWLIPILYTRSVTMRDKRDDIMMMTITEMLFLFLNLVLIFFCLIHVKETQELTELRNESLHFISVRYSIPKEIIDAGGKIIVQNYAFVPFGTTSQDNRMYLMIGPCDIFTRTMDKCVDYGILDIQLHGISALDKYVTQKLINQHGLNFLKSDNVYQIDPCKSSNRYAIYMTIIATINTFFFFLDMYITSMFVGTLEEANEKNKKQS
jgi:hypothetical protein